MISSGIWSKVPTSEQTNKRCRKLRIKRDNKLLRSKASYTSSARNKIHVSQLILNQLRSSVWEPASLSLTQRRVSQRKLMAKEMCVQSNSSLPWYVLPRPAGAAPDPRGLLRSSYLLSSTAPGHEFNFRNREWLLGAGTAVSVTPGRGETGPLVTWLPTHRYHYPLHPPLKTDFRVCSHFGAYY